MIEFLTGIFLISLIFIIVNLEDKIEEIIKLKKELLTIQIDKLKE